MLSQTHPPPPPHTTTPPSAHPSDALWAALRRLDWTTAETIIHHAPTPTPSYLTAPHARTALTPLQLTSLLGASGATRALLTRGATPDALCVRNAARNGHAPVLRLLLSAHHTHHLALGAALLDAAWYARVECVRALIEAGADVACRASDGACALHYAALAGSVDMVRMLLAAGADVRVRDYMARTPLCWVRASGGPADAAVLDMLGSAERAYSMPRRALGLERLLNEEENGLSDTCSDVTDNKSSFDLETVPDVRRKGNGNGHRNRRHLFGLTCASVEESLGA